MPFSVFFSFFFPLSCGCLKVRRWRKSDCVERFLKWQRGNGVHGSVSRLRQPDCLWRLQKDGFINIDCGIPSNTVNPNFYTGLTYVSDDQYIGTGVNGKISSQYPPNNTTVHPDFDTLRSFPNGTKNCYNLKPVTKGSTYLVRATFYYGNYDQSAMPPSFDLYFGVNFWCTVKIDKPDVWYHCEIIGIAPANYIDVCLVNTGHGIPFINALELRPLNSSLYKLANSTQSLNTFNRFDIGSVAPYALRYPKDAHDRIWFSWTIDSTTTVSTNFSVDGSDLDVPSLVLQTADFPSTKNSISITPWPDVTTGSSVFVMLHFSEIQNLQNNSLREFYLYANGELAFNYPIPLGYLKPSYVNYTTKGSNMTIQSSSRATLPPILNAYEIFTILPVIWLPTNYGDVVAINKIKASYNVNQNWSGDPCVPTGLGWTGVNCTTDTPRITDLNLSSKGLTGEMVTAFGDLTALNKLDLSRNNLSGNIPSSLDNLVSLTFLDLSGNNKLVCTLPSGLQKRLDKKQLTVNFNDTAPPTPPDSGHKGKSSKVVIVSVVVVLLLIIGAAVLFLFYRRRGARINQSRLGENPGESNGEWRETNFNIKQFSYAELKLITSNFSERIGVGGFGEVFKGQLNDGNEVAVKVSSESSQQGTQQFLNEVEILSRARHKNLVSLIGYCKDGNRVALVYEYMHGGSLQDWLQGNGQSLSWKQRLQIIYESAQGLEYLHRMCNPPLIHRDVKTSNILLTRNLEAKVSDFGLVRSCVGTQVSTRIMGTPGYLDPSYASTSHLTEKSDVYSFGVILLEIITGKQPIGHGLPMGQHLTQFVKKMLSNGDIEGILDPSMEKPNNLSSVWKVADDLAVRCTGLLDKRPDMTEVVTELKEILNLEMSSTATSMVVSGNMSDYSGYSKSDNLVSGGFSSINYEMTHIEGDYGPMAR